MDFVVIGLGLSALALLTGLTLLCMVAPRWSRKSSVAHPADSAYARAVAGERQALGQGFLCVGAVLLLATLGGISAGLPDKAGAYLIAAITTVAALGLFGWDILYRRQHPVPQRRRVAAARAKPAPADASAAPASLSPDGSPAAAPTTVRRRVLPARQRVASPTQPASAGKSKELPADVEPNSDGEALHDEPLARVAEDAETPEAAGIQAEPAAENPVAAADPDAPAERPTAQEEAPEGPESAELERGETADVATELPEPAPFPPAQPNGAAEPAAAVAADLEPDLVPDGDDRVIALFPTAAAHRSRMMTAPTDPDGKS